MASTKELRRHRLSAQMLTDPNDRFDHALAEWFVHHRGGWAGTAGELISVVNGKAEFGNDLWRQPASALYAHIESRRNSLHSLGVDVLLHPGFPRIVSLRTCEEGKFPGNLPSHERAVNRISDLTNERNSFADPKTVHPVSNLLIPTENLVSNPASDSFEPVDAERIDHDQHTGREISRGHAFEDTAKALFGIVEMRDRIKEQGLDLKSTMHLVANRTQAIAGSSGVALGWLQQDTLVCPAQVGIASVIAGMSWQADLLRSCISKGVVLPLPDAQQDPLVGASCRRESIKSLIVAPIFQDRKVAGAMELLFNETRSFSSGDVMILELIADLISEQLAGVGKEAGMQPQAKEPTVPLRITEDIEPRTGEDHADEPRWGYSQDANPGAASKVFANLGSNIPANLAVSASASAPRRRVWTRLP